jgi:hypothetical protein
MSSISPQVVCEELTSQEADQMMIGPSITTATFMRGDVEAAGKIIRNRLAQLVHANPWLTGTLVKTGDGKVSLSYSASPTADQIDLLFNPSGAAKAPELSSTMDFVQICRSVSSSSAEIAKGSDCVDNSRPLVAVSLLPDSLRPQDTFALIFSCSHVILDGFSHYRLLSMLCTNGTIVALNASRKHEIVQQADLATGLKESAFLRSKSLVCNVVCSMFCGRTPMLETYYVDSDRVKLAKSEARGVDFVSTNDVLVSAFANATQARMMLMPINFRGKLAGFTDADAGNYEGALMFGPDDYAEPAYIRKTFLSGPPTFLRETTTALPGCCETVRCQLSMVTNWAFGCFQEVVIDNCEQMLHVPVCNVSLVPFDCAVVYRPRANQLAVACFTRSIGAKELEAEFPIGSKISCAEDGFTYSK